MDQRCRTKHYQPAQDINDFDSRGVLNHDQFTRSIGPKSPRSLELESQSSLPFTLRQCVRRTHREWPISLRLDNGQQVNGWIDLLLETEDGSVIVDHKSFPGRDPATRIGRYAPQLRMYAQAMEAAEAGPVVAGLIHLPVLGKVFQVTERSGGTNVK